MKEKMKENVGAGIGSTGPQRLADRAVRYKIGHLTNVKLYKNENETKT